MKIGVIAGPLRETASAARGQEMTQDIAVGIEDADVRDRAGADLLLPARLPEKRLRREDRRRPMVLVAEERRPFLPVVHPRLCHPIPSAAYRASYCLRWPIATVDGDLAPS